MNLDYVQLPGWPETPPKPPSFSSKLSLHSLPTISVVCPSFNQGHFLESLLLSIGYQNYPKTQLIVIDNNSTDTTSTLLAEYDTLISTAVSEKDRGQSHAINKGFAIATGTVAAWQNADDIYMPNALWRVAQSVLNSSSPGDTIYMGHTKIIEDDKVTGSKYITPYTNNYLIHRGVNFSTQSLFFGENIYKNNPIDESLHYAMDGEYMLRTAGTGVTHKLINHHLGGYRWHEAAKSIAGCEQSRAEWDRVLENWSRPAKKRRIMATLLLAQRICQLALQNNLLPAMLEKPKKKKR